MTADPLWSNRSLLIEFDGTAGNAVAEGFTANSVVTFVGSANKSSAPVRAGRKTCLQVPGAGSYCSVPHTSAYNFGTGDFTVEGWIWIDPSFAFVGNQISFMCAGRQETSSSGLGWDCHLFSTGVMRVETIPATGQVFSDAINVGTIPRGAWVHVAFMRASGVCKVALNGVVYTGTAALSGKTVNNPNSLSVLIGGSGTVGNANFYPFKGFIDTVRITKGAALYSANFTPEETWPRGSVVGTLSGTVTDDTGSPAIRSLAAYRRDTGALLATAKSDATGAYSMPVDYSGECYVVCLDDAAGTVYNALIEDRVVPT